MCYVCVCLCACGRCLSVCVCACVCVRACVWLVCARVCVVGVCERGIWRHSIQGPTMDGFEAVPTERLGGEHVFDFSNLLGPSTARIATNRKPTVVGVNTASTILGSTTPVRSHGHVITGLIDEARRQSTMEHVPFQHPFCSF